MPTFSSQLAQRFHELETQASEIKVGSHDGLSPHAAPQEFYAWASSALHAIQGAFGSGSPHHTNFQREMQSITNNYVSDFEFRSIRGIFLGAKNDVDGGYLFDFQKSVSGELFGDLVASAKTALGEGHHTVAAVLACAALEDALKRFALLNGLSVEGQTMEHVINALKSKGLVSGAQKGLLSAMPKVRNQAMHAEWDKLTPQEVGSVIGFVEQFLLVHF